MKKDYEKYSKNLGIAKTKLDGEDIFVVYFDAMPECSFGCCVGSVIGKGKNEKEALKDCVIKLCKEILKLKKMQEKFEKNFNHINRYIMNFEYDMGDCMIPTFDFITNENGDTSCIESKTEKSNADVFIMEDGTVQLGHC